MTALFGMVMQVGQFEIIDEMHVTVEILKHIEAKMPEQRRVHASLTATIDVAYPFAYAGFPIGFVSKACPRAGFLWLFSAFW